MPKSLNLSYPEMDALRNLLIETQQVMDDDGNSGAFDASPLRAVYNRLTELWRTTPPTKS
jgi:predicted hotdog family 3-hydroxylacyl-ACP dehydratase